jgi:hypothetical protein
VIDEVQRLVPHVLLAHICLKHQSKDECTSALMGCSFVGARPVRCHQLRSGGCSGLLSSCQGGMQAQIVKDLIKKRLPAHVSALSLVLVTGAVSCTKAAGGGAR